jgi:hypothetical protein
MIKSQLRHAIAAAFAVAAAAPGAAFAIYEVEPNDSAMSAQLLPGNPDGAPVEVTGVLGETSRRQVDAATGNDARKRPVAGAVRHRTTGRVGSG